MPDDNKRLIVQVLFQGRLDKALAQSIQADAGLSRTRIRALIEAGSVRILGQGPILDPKYTAQVDDIFEIIFEELAPLELVGEDIPLDIYYEDPDLIVVNKPAGMVVHPALHARSGTLVQALLHHTHGVLSGIGGALRPGIVHRIDKDTSGLLVVAKTDRAHFGLARQFEAHTVVRLYQAFTYGVLRLDHPRVLGLEGVSHVQDRLKINQPIGRHKVDRLRQAVRADGKAATSWIRVQHVLEDAGISWIECRLETGRTHQIRVHMSYIGHALLGDPLYAPKKRLDAVRDPKLKEIIRALPGQALHAEVLGFVHPVTGIDLHFEAPFPAHLLPLAAYFAP